MVGRRSSGKAPGLHRESPTVGQPRGERFTLQTSKTSKNLIATSASSTQITIDTDTSCVFCLEIYQENMEVWQAQPCGHIFHSDCVKEAGFPITKDCYYADKRTSGTKGPKNHVLLVVATSLSGYLQRQILRTGPAARQIQIPLSFKLHAAYTTAVIGGRG